MSYVFVSSLGPQSFHFCVSLGQSRNATRGKICGIVDAPFIPMCQERPMKRSLSHHLIILNTKDSYNCASTWINKMEKQNLPEQKSLGLFPTGLDQTCENPFGKEA